MMYLIENEDSRAIVYDFTLYPEYSFLFACSAIFVSIQCSYFVRRIMRVQILFLAGFIIAYFLISTFSLLSKQVWQSWKLSINYFVERA